MKNMNPMKRLLSIALSAAMVLSLLPLPTLLRQANAAGTVAVDTTPVYSEYIFDLIKDEYIYNENIASAREPMTTYASVAVLYDFMRDEGDTTTHMYRNNYFSSSKDNVLPSAHFVGLRGNRWNADCELFDGRLYAAFRNEDVRVHFGGTFTSTKNNKPTMTVGGVSIGSGMAAKSTQRQEGVADPAGTIDRINFNGGSGTEIRNPWMALIDNGLAYPVVNSIECSFSGGILAVKIPMDEQLRWANKNADEHVNKIWIEVTLVNELTGVESDAVRLNLVNYRDGFDSALEFSGYLSEDWANAHFSVSRITNVSIPTETQIPFEVYGIVGCYDTLVTTDNYGRPVYRVLRNPSRQIGKRDEQGNIIDYTLDTTPITDLAGNRVDLSGLINLRLNNMVFDKLAPVITGVSLTPADGINREESTNPVIKEDSQDSWPTEIDRKQLLVGAGQKLTFTMDISEEVTTSGITAKLNVCDKTGAQVVLKLQSANTIGGTLYSEMNSTRLTFETFTAADGMYMMAGHEGKSIRIVELTGTIQDGGGNRCTGSIPAPAQRLFLDVLEPAVKVERIETGESNSNTLELLVTVSDKLQTMNAGILDQSLKLWVSGTATQAVNYQYTLDLYPNPFQAVSGSAKLGAQKSGDPISYILRALDEATLKLTLTFDENAAIAIEDITVFAEITDVSGNALVSSYPVTYELDKVPPTLTVGAAQYRYSVSSATVTIPVSAGDAHNQVAKLEYQWTSSAAAAPTEWETAAITQGANVEYTVTRTYNDTQNHEEVLWIRATDTKGLSSDVKSVAVKVDLSMPATSYSVTADPNLPNAQPVVTVNGPAARASDNADGYTRITVTMGSSTYVRVVKTGSSINVFDFDGTWYQVTKGASTFTAVTEVSDTAVLKNYYGPVTITFDNAYVDLTPVNSGVIVPTGAGYFADPAQVAILYAPAQATHIHSLTWDNYYNADNQVIEGTGAIGFHQTMTGIRVDFSLANALQSGWGLMDIDFDKSTVELCKIEGDTAVVLVTNGLQAAATQSFTIPYLTDAGEKLTTGMYRIVVHVVSRSGQKDSFTSPRSLVLDADPVSNAGLWTYSLRDGSQLSAAVHMTAQTQPFDSFGMAMGVKQEIYRDDMFAYYSNGVGQMTITLATDEEQITYDGITVGKVEGFRLWPMMANLTREQVNALPFQSPTSHGNGQAKYILTLGATLVDAADYPQGTDGVPYPGGELKLVKGLNTLCYQVRMENGMTAEGQFTIFVTDELPHVEMSVDSVTPSMILSEIEGQMNVQNVTVKLDSAFSMNGSGKVTVTMLNGGKAPKINGVDAGDSATVNVNDLITLCDDSYTSEYTEEVDPSTTKTLFIARDEFGGTVIIAPQIGSDYRIDGDRAVNYYDYPLNHWTEVQYGIQYNEPQYDEDGNITGYVTSEFWDDKLGADRTTNATLDYNRYAINTDVPTATKSGYYYSSDTSRSYVKAFLELSHMSYLDWSTATLTLPTMDGDTVTLPIDHSGINKAGLICTELKEYSGKFYVLIAKPVAEDDALVGTKALSYTSMTLNIKDTLGNDREFYIGYSLEYISAAPRGGISVDGYYLTLPTAAYSASPIDATREFGAHIGTLGGEYFWQINTGSYNAGTYSGTYTDMYGNTHAFAHEMEVWEEGLDITVSPTTPTGGPVTVVIKSTKGEAVQVATGEDGQTITGNGTTEVTVTLTQNGYVTYQTDTIWERMIKVSNIVNPGLQVLWSYDEDAVATDENGVAYHYGPVTAYLISASGQDVDVIDNYTGETPSYTFYPGEATSYTFKASDFTVKAGNTVLDCEDVTAVLQVELRSVEQPPADDNPDIPPETPDTNSPAVQLRAYAQRNGLYTSEQKSLQVEPGIYTDILTDYPGEATFVTGNAQADTEAYVSSLGWATAFRFQIEVQDDHKTKLFIKDSLYTQAPGYDSGVSDTIEGISLNGRVLEVSAPAAFTLFVVDEENNATAIPMALTNIGTAPVPLIQKIPGEQVIYAYLLPPAGAADGEITDLKLTYPDGVAQATEGAYSGYWYAPLETNGIHTLHYSYTYKGEHVSGKLDVEVTELDTTPIELKKDGIIWSANKLQPMTNQDVTVQLHFTKPVSTVQVPGEYVDCMEVLITGTRVTVRYGANTDAVVMTVVAANGTGTYLTLDAVTNIDKASPAAQVEKQVLSEDGKTVTVYLRTDEQALLRELGCYGTDNGDGSYSYTCTVKENGSYTACFIDQAGNITQLSYEVTAIVDEPLTLMFNTAPSDDGAVSDPDGIQLSVGDTIYVKASRDCTISMNRAQSRNAKADTWVSFTIAESDAGLWPIIHAEDAFGNTAAGQFGSVKLPDRTAPVATLVKSVVVAKVGTDRSEILSLLEENLIVTDLDPNTTVSIDFTEDLQLQGVTSVTYTATDSAGNKVSVTGWLRLTSAGEPAVKINGQTVDRDSIYLSTDSKLELTVDVYGEPYSVVWRKGIKTVGQMKIGSTDLLRNETQMVPVALPFTESGYYTICIRTQSRDEYRIIVYVS